MSAIAVVIAAVAGLLIYSAVKGENPLDVLKGIAQPGS